MMLARWLEVGVIGTELHSDALFFIRTYLEHLPLELCLQTHL